MKSKKYRRLFVFSFTVFISLWVLISGEYIGSWSYAKKSSMMTSPSVKINSRENNNDEPALDEYRKPVYFSLFKFIYNFVPAKSKPANKILEKTLNLALGL